MNRFEFAQVAERKVGYQLYRQGHQIELQSYHSSFDLLVDGTIRVEVKASRWNDVRRRYQANVRNSADFVVFCAVNGTFHFFVIPGKEIGSRQNIAIFSHDPAEYGGKWARFLDAWDLIKAEDI